MNAHSHQLYSFLSDRMDKGIAEKLTMYIDSRIHQVMTEQTNHLATREDLANMKTELLNMKAELLKYFITLFITLIIAVAGILLKK
jgi:hypothetical protein